MFGILTRYSTTDLREYLQNQAHTCKTLGIVTKPKSIASSHAQMRPRNIIHARVITFVYTRDHAQRLKALGVVASTKVQLVQVLVRAISRARHVKHHAS